MNMSKSQYVDSVMRVLGKCSNQVTLDDLEELQILLESEYDRVLDAREAMNSRHSSDLAHIQIDKTYLSQRMLMHLQAG